MKTTTTCACPHLLNTLVIPSINLHFTSESSRLKLEINEQGSRDIIEHIRQGLLDVGFIAVNKTNMGLIDNLHFIPVFEGELMVPNHQYAGHLPFHLEIKCSNDWP